MTSPFRSDGFQLLGFNPGGGLIYVVLQIDGSNTYILSATNQQSNEEELRTQIDSETFYEPPVPRRSSGEKVSRDLLIEEDVLSSLMGNDRCIVSCDDEEYNWVALTIPEGDIVVFQKDLLQSQAGDFSLKLKQIV